MALSQIDKYEQPIGVVGQRVLGVAVVAHLLLAAWYVVVTCLDVLSGRALTDPIWVPIGVVAVFPWLTVLAVRLLQGRMGKRRLLPPLGLVTIGLLLFAGTLWFARSGTDMTTRQGRRAVMGGLLVASVSLLVGIVRWRSARSVPNEELKPAASPSSLVE